MNIRNLTFLSILSLPLLLATTSAAHAYLDPGTGSMILQIILGGVAGILVVGKLYWAKFTSLFSRGGDTAEEAEAAHADEK